MNAEIEALRQVQREAADEFLRTGSAYARLGVCDYLDEELEIEREGQ